MRKILFLLSILLISIASNAQEVKISELSTASGYGDDDDVIIINEDGATKKIAKANFLHHSTMYVNTLSEYSNNNGIYIDGLQIKDGNIHLGLGNYYYLDDDLDSYFFGNADDDVYLVAGSVLSFSATGSLFSLNLNTVPNVNNTYDLGSSTKYWARVYAMDLLLGDDLDMETTGYIQLDSDDDTRIGAQADDDILVVVNNNSVLRLTDTWVYFGSIPRPWTSDAYDLGYSNAYWKDVYAQKYVIDASGSYINLSGTDMQLTDPNAGSHILHDIVDNTLTENAQTGTTYTLVLADAGKRVTLTNAAEITLTVPPNSSVAFPTGTRIELEQWGAGDVIITEGSGVTINSLDGGDALSDQYSTATLIKDDTDTWILKGDLVNTPISTFTGTLFKMVTFSEVAVGELSEAKWQTMLESSDITYTVETGNEVDAYDSTVTMTVNGSTDTVRLVMMGDDQGSTGDGVLINGDIHLNGSNNIHDTLTDVCIKLSVMFEAWPYEFSNGGKIGGFGATGTDGEKPPDAGSYECLCGGKQVWETLCSTDGMNAKIGFREGSGDEDVISYQYSHEMVVNCSEPPTYGITITDGEDGYAADTWYEFTIRARLNTGGLYNGIIEVFRNDTCVYSDNEYKWVDTDGIKIDYWMLENFAGGTPDNDWAGARIWMDDILLFQPNKWDAYGEGVVMTNVPDFHTDNND